MVKDAQGSLELPRGKLVRIEQARGTLVSVASGCVWITEEGDRRDRFIGAGQAFRILSDGVTLISALARSSITLAAA